MKKIVFTLSLLISLQLVSSAQKYGFENLAGTWRNSKGAGLDVVDSNTVYIVHGGQRMRAVARLSDFSKNPVWLNLLVKDSSHVFTLKSLLLFVNDNTLQWQLFDSDTKPANYRYDKGDMLFLKKIEPLTN